jgi:hypothetical protein
VVYEKYGHFFMVYEILTEVLLAHLRASQVETIRLRYTIYDILLTGVHVHLAYLYV